MYIFFLSCFAFNHFEKISKYERAMQTIHPKSVSIHQKPPRLHFDCQESVQLLTYGRSNSKDVFTMFNKLLEGLYYEFKQGSPLVSHNFDKFLQSIKELYPDATIRLQIFADDSLQLNIDEEDIIIAKHITGATAITEELVLELTM